MSVEEDLKLAHELAVEVRKQGLLKEELPSEDEFIRQELAWLADFLRKHFKLSREEIRRKILEKLDVTV